MLVFEEEWHHNTSSIPMNADPAFKCLTELDVPCPNRNGAFIRLIKFFRYEQIA